MNVTYQDTGFPHGVQLRTMANNVAVTGEFHIYNVINASASNQTIQFNNQSHLSQITMRPDQVLNLSYPIHCTNFTPSDAALIVVYASGIS